MEITSKYYWKLQKVSPENQELLTLWDNIISSDKSTPITNQSLFMLPLHEHVFPEETLYLAICYQNEEPLTVLPFMHLKQSKYGCSWYDLGTPLHPHVNLFNLPNCDNISHELLFNQLFSDARKWPMKWQRLIIRNLISHDKFEHSYNAGDMAWFNTKDATGIQQIVSKKLVKNFNRLERKLHRDFQPYSLEVCDSSNIQKNLDIFFNLEFESWKHSDKIAVKGNPELEDFYHDLLINFSKSNSSRIYFYRSSENIIAGALGFKLHDTLYIHKTCFNSDYHQYAPGGLLIYHIIESAISQNDINRISLVTSPSWAKRWHPKKTRVANLMVYNKTIKARLCGMADPLIKYIRKNIKHLYLIVLKKHP